MYEQTILVVDDEPDIADLYTAWLETDHEVRTAYCGRTALKKADDDVDMVFLDRQIPDLSGDEVLERIRERGLDCRVVMVTAVDPDFDIVEMPFDDYLTKPVMRRNIEDAVENMQERESYTETIREYYALTAKKATLEAEKSPAELRNSRKYQWIDRRIAELADEADSLVDDIDDDALFKELSEA
jgi:DNA-binding response OmpR family regulator